MEKYYIESFMVNKLWGWRNFVIRFNKDVNIIIGPNASGKTTILNMLRFILTAEVLNLIGIEFLEATLKLESFEGSYTKTIKVIPNEKGYEYIISKEKINIVLPFMDKDQSLFSHQRKLILHKVAELQEKLQGLVPAIWLPVSRRLPIPEDDEYTRYPSRKRLYKLESVDERLRELIEELSHYRLRLEAQLSELYKNFEKRVLEIILYNKEHDQISSFRISSPPTLEEKDQLLGAFKVAGLLDEKMNKRIQDHFTTAEETLQRFTARRDESKIEIEDIFIIPLIHRTKAMVAFARNLEKQRDDLFRPLRHYEEIVNSFLNQKHVTVEDSGKLRIEATSGERKHLSPELLSSGEKQILILLTQALLYEHQPVVYVADEPELSLHVEWQEKLLKSLRDLGNQIQIIVATHSPDIIGPYRDKIIKLGVNNS